jgi:hypothetical protein
VLARVLPADGRSRAYLDGRLATAGELAELGGALVDLHGQHAHQSLLVPAVQRAALDRFAGAEALDALARLRAAREDGRALRTELDALGGDDRARAREADLLRFQVEEIDGAAIDDPGEDDALRAEEAMLADATAIREALAAAYHAVEDDGVDALGAAAASLDRVRRAHRAPHAREGASRRAATSSGGTCASRPTASSTIRPARGGAGPSPAAATAPPQVRRHPGRRARLPGRGGERLAQLEHHDEHAARLQAEIAAAAHQGHDRGRGSPPSPRRGGRAHGRGGVGSPRELAMPRAEVTIAVEPAISPTTAPTS